MKDNTVKYFQVGDIYRWDKDGDFDEYLVVNKNEKSIDLKHIASNNMQIRPDKIYNWHMITDDHRCVTLIPKELYKSKIGQLLW